MSLGVGAGPAVDPHRARATVLHRSRGVRPGVRQGVAAPGDVLQGHEEDPKPRVLRPVVQQTELLRGDRSLQARQEEAASQGRGVLDRGRA